MAAQPPGQGGYGYPGPAAQPGVPRTSYNQVRTVGERQYGQQGAYGYPQAQNAQYGQPQGQYGQPNAQYAAPETYPGAPTTQVPHQGGRGNGGPGKGGPNTKGLLIGAVAVVAVVLIGIGAALMTGDGGKDKKKEEATSSSGAAGEVQESPKPQNSASSEAPAELPKQDAASLKLGGTATIDKAIGGAEGPNGSYVTGFNAVGSSVTWTANLHAAWFVPPDGPLRDPRQGRQRHADGQREAELPADRAQELHRLLGLELGEELADHLGAGQPDEWRERDQHFVPGRKPVRRDPRLGRGHTREGLSSPDASPSPRGVC